MDAIVRIGVSVLVAAALVVVTSYVWGLLTVVVVIGWLAYAATQMIQAVRADTDSSRN